MVSFTTTTTTAAALTLFSLLSSTHAHVVQTPRQITIATLLPGCMAALGPGNPQPIIDKSGGHIIISSLPSICITEAIALPQGIVQGQVSIQGDTVTVEDTAQNEAIVAGLNGGAAPAPESRPNLVEKVARKRNGGAVIVL